MKNTSAMDLDNQERFLRVLIKNAKNILEAKFGVNAAETTFFEVISLLRSQSKLKETFLQLAKETFASADGWGFDGDAIPRELIELVAHEMKWPELVDLAHDRINRKFGGDPKMAIGDLAIRVQSALNSDWPDREFYEHYQK
jgi:hypothetical protein